MLTRKLLGRNGLCNGSIGTISDIVNKKSDKPTTLPIAVMIQFDFTSNGSSCCFEKPRCNAVISKTSELDL